MYNKFINFDEELKYPDENTFNELLGIIDIKLWRTETVPYSQQYVDWCRRHNRVPVGDRLNIGYLPDIDKKLNDYRRWLLGNEQ